MHAPQALSERRDGRGMGLRRPLAESADPVGAAAAPRSARGLQRAALAGPYRRRVAQPTQRLPALAGGLPTDATVARGQLLRDHRRRPAGVPAGGRGRELEPKAIVLDGCTLRSTPESGHRTGYVGHMRTKGSKRHDAFDTLGPVLAACRTPSNEQEQAQVGHGRRRSKT